MPNSACKDVPAPGTGYKCVCPAGTALEGTACVDCVRIVAGVTGQGGTFVENTNVTEATLSAPVDVSVNEDEDIFITSECVCMCCLASLARPMQCMSSGGGLSMVHALDVISNMCAWLLLRDCISRG